MLMANAARPRGRPKGGRVFDESDILDAALDVLADGGYAALSMRGVARAMGASLATVQRHFATKDDLWRGAVDAFLATAELPSFDGSEDPLRAGVAQMLELGSQRPGLVTAILCDRAPGHSERFAHIADRLAERYRIVHATISTSKEMGTLRAFDAHALLLLMNVGIGAIASAPAAARDIYGFDLEDPAERDRLAGALADIVRSGLLDEGSR